VEHIDLIQLNFKISSLNKEGRPAYASKLFLKIYLYGYLNGLRSSRKLERECIRNIELQWLTNNLQPNYTTENRVKLTLFKSHLIAMHTILQTQFLAF
jgi:transposase